MTKARSLRKNALIECNIYGIYALIRCNQETICTFGKTISASAA